MLKLAPTLVLSCAISGLLGAMPAQAEFNDKQMKAMLASADLLGRADAVAEACGTETAAMAAAMARNWKCQGASADQITKLQATVAAARKRGKVAACPGDKAVNAKAYAATTAQLEAAAAVAKCQG